MRHLAIVKLTRIILRSVFALSVALSLAGIPTLNAHAAAITVDSTSDVLPIVNGQCTLREAIQNANNDAATNADCAAGTGNDTITFSVSGTITLLLNNALPNITDADGLTIDGANSITVRGNGRRIVQINLGAVVTLQDITLTKGNQSAAGGALHNSGTLTLNHVTLSSNKGTTGGAVYNTGGTLTITNSTLSSNQGSNGGGVYNTGGTVTISSSSFLSNVAQGSGSDGGAIVSTGTGSSLSITNTLFQNNQSGATGGAIRVDNGSASITTSTFSGNSVIRTNSGTGTTLGGAVFNSNKPVTISNSTFSNNSARATDAGNSGVVRGGAIYSTGSSANTIVVNSTFSGNSVTTSGTGATAGGNLYRNSGTLRLTNTIVNNGAPNNCAGTITDNGDNIDSGVTCGFGGGSLSTTDPLLGALTGSPGYFPLNAGSPAMDAGDAATCSAAPVSNASQNGVTRPKDGDDNGTVICDIGSYEAPGTPPAVASITRVNPSPTASASVQFTVTFTETVSGVNSADFNLTTTGTIAGASITTVFANSASTYTLTVNTGSGDGTIRLDVTDDDSITSTIDGNLLGGTGAGNGNYTSGETYTVDRTNPTVTFNQAGGQSDPTNTAPVTFDVIFNESVTGFISGDVDLSASTAAGTLVAGVSGSGAVYTVSVSGMTGDGAVIASLPLGAAQDLAGNNSAASTSTDNSITYDTTGPTVTVNQAGTQPDPANTHPIRFAVIFNEPVTGFTAADVTLSGTAGASTATVTGSGTTYVVSAKNFASDGTVIVSLNAGVAIDAAGNGNSASTSTDNTVTYIYTVPMVTIDQAVDQPDPANNPSIKFDVLFNKGVYGFTSGDVDLSASTAPGTLVASVTGSDGDAAYTVFVSGMTGDGAIVASIFANAAQDIDLNNSTASTSDDNSVTYDVTQPDTTIGSTPGDPDNDNTPTFTFSGDDGLGSGVAGFECQMDSGGYSTCASPFTVAPALDDGSHTFYVRAVDNAGNKDASPDSYTWTVDTDAPQTTIDSQTPSTTPTNSTSMDFTFSSDEIGSTFQCKLDGGSYASCTSPASYTSLGDGSHTFYVFATDTAGNDDATPASYTWTVDTNPPETTIDSAEPSTPATTFTSMDLTFSSDEGGSTFQCRLDGGSYGSCTSPVSYTGLSEASHTFDVYATDPVGNDDPTPESYTWIVDTTVPDTTIDSSPPDPDNAASPIFTFSIDDGSGSGLGGFECQMDGGGFVECASGDTFGPLVDGSHTFDVYAIDLAGNVDPSPDSYTWTVDTVAPGTTIDSETPSTTPTKITSMDFTFSSDEIGSTFQCKLDGGSYGTCTSPIGYTSLGDGSHTFYVYATDTAGNDDASPDSYTWTVDTDAPETTIDSETPSTTPTNFTSMDFTFSSDEIGSTFQCKLDGGIYASCTSPASYTSLGDGSHTFYVYATDPSGNDDLSPDSYTWDIDTEKPEISIGAPSVSVTDTGPVDFSITVSGADSVNLTTGDVTLNATGTAAGDVSVTSGTTNNPTVTISNTTGDGTLGISIAAGVASDISGNDNILTGPSTTFFVDNTAPVLTLPADIIAEATSPSGAVVGFTVTAVDAVDPSPTVTCVPPSGSLFPLGTTTVDCTAADSLGNESAGSFTVTVENTLPPVLTLPADITEPATSLSGAIVNFTVTATDNVDPSPTVTCVPPSGSTFPIGTTTVDCTAADSNGNESTGSFTVTVVDVTAPFVVSSTRVDPDPTGLASVQFTVTFSEPVTGVDPGDFTLTTTGLTLASVTGFSGSDDTYTVTVDTGFGDGTIRLDVLDDNSIVDGGGNPLDGAFTGGETYTVIKTPVELIVNGSFEIDANLDKRPDSWRYVSLTTGLDRLDSKYRKFDAYSMKFTGESKIKKMITQRFFFSGNAGDDFTLSLWSRAANAPSNAVYRAEMIFYNGAAQIGASSINFATGSHGFVKGSATFTAPVSFTKIVVRIVYQAVSGSVWFDGVSLLYTP